MAENKNVAKKGGSKMLEGVLLGAVLGIATGLFVNSKAGKAAGEDVKKRAADFYKYITPKLKKAKKMGEAEFKAFVKDAVRAYSKNKKLTEVEAKHLLKEAQTSWKHFAKHL